MEGAEVAGVHDINGEMLKFGAGTTEEVGELGILLCSGLEVAVVGDEGLPVGSRWGEVLKVQRAIDSLSRIAHPAKGVGGHRAKPKALLEPFPISADLKQSGLWNQKVVCDPLALVVR